MEENSGAGACGYPKKKALLLFNALLLSVGNCGGPLIMRLYFLRGGNRVWLSSALETAGWPAVLVPILASYILRRRAPPVQDAKRKLFVIGRRVFLASAAVGILIGLDDYFYAYGMARLPVSTSSLIIAAQLAFTAVFAFLLVRQRFTAYSVNAVFLLTVGAGVLALHTSGDRPAGESGREYLVGFLMTVAAAVLYGFILPAVELVYKKAKQEMSYSLVMEIQMVMCIFATGFCTVGMLVNHDFQAISREAKHYELGEAKYYTVLVSNAIIWQCFFLGSIGVVFCASSLLSGVIIAMLLPVTEILAVFFFHEKFQAEKGVALALSLWGFLSYFYGELKHSKTESPRAETEMQQTV